MSHEKIALHDVDLKQSLENVLSLVREGNLGRTVEVLASLPAAEVLADELLDEVFVNILSNAVEYTEGIEVSIEIRLEQEEGRTRTAGRRSTTGK